MSNTRLCGKRHKCRVSEKAGHPQAAGKAIRQGNSEQIKLKILADASDAAIKDNKIDILGEPNIDHEKVELPAAGAMKFDFEVEVRPEFELPNLEGIPVNKTKIEISDEQITEGDRTIAEIFRHVDTAEKMEAIELDDQVIADAVLKIEGVEEEEKHNNIEVYRPAERFCQFDSG